jgi:hypothetical protein
MSRRDKRRNRNWAKGVGAQSNKSLIAIVVIGKDKRAVCSLERVGWSGYRKAGHM